MGNQGMSKIKHGDTPQFTPGKFGWQGERDDFFARLMGAEGQVPYVVVRCGCSRHFSEGCNCHDIVVAPIFNSDERWCEAWLNEH